VICDTNISIDPKVHFTEQTKAIEFYNFMVNLLVSEEKFARVNVLEHGAL